MLHYRAYLLDEHRHVISAANLYCAHEQAAKERAQQLVGVNDVELWQLDRRIAVFNLILDPPQTIDVGHGRPVGAMPRVSQAEQCWRPSNLIVARPKQPGDNRLR